MENWHEYGQILDRIERIMKAYFPQSGVNPEIEKWHQDEPVITARWIGADGIERNINMYLDDSPENCSLRISANAWRDDQTERERRWIYHEFTDIDFSGWRKEFRVTILCVLINLLDIAFSKISSITDSDLTMNNKFPPNPAAKK
ncbi:MAG: hypothetical protein A3G49_04325 [Candidatus Sungbacteria bacterium RIFCSPLOWO2_12_FULL_41_11]|uniref:Uncharacterized protein n=1 Tax=Candidatus Sungbacteria bacterium RIFCSPLOWO2_12_FULL_41_11 TaxID=1802286 RepID=A0A1G2LTB4_9BACT|nr:MAG: hypothetical protein UV01_C0010G0002 [Parcubacteria group bacterium GW2011_GWA2_42_14]OHA14885.1 MAG: hypothetical protein A3G49_04325 [Candidatus Sungbacteria bacterium RIFCSPLOWO2_12_FULL_41_11]